MDFVNTDAEMHMVNVLNNISDKSKENLITIINKHTNSNEKYYCNYKFVVWLTNEDKCINLRGEMINYQNKVITLFFVYDDILKRNILINYILPGDGSLKLNYF